MHFESKGFELFNEMKGLLLYDFVLQNYNETFN